MTSRLRRHLASVAASAVDRHHLVLWHDEARSYEAVVDTVCPDGARLVKYEGSWFDLRQRIEDDLALADPPRLVVYVSHPAPAHDPLAEVRAASDELVLPIGDLVRDGLAAHLPVSQLAEIARTATSFEEADAAAQGGVAAGFVSLVPVLGAGLTDVGMLVGVLGGRRDDALTAKGAWRDVQRLAEKTIGIAVGDTEQAFRESIARQLLLQAVHSVGALPDRLTTAVLPATDEQSAARSQLLDQWWSATPTVARAAFATADAQTKVGDGAAWTNGLGEVDVAASVEVLAAQQVLTLLGEGRADDALALAERRARGRWVRAAVLDASADDGWWTRWRAVVSLVELHRELQSNPSPPLSNSGQVLEWYAERGWQVDRAHRMLELALTALAEYGVLEQPVAGARAAYESWLGAVIEGYTTAIANNGYSTGDLLRQSEVFPKYVRGAEELTAYIWVDAFRFELATDVAQSLRAAGNDVELRAAVAAAPTITPVGMANLCPGSDTTFALDEIAGALRVTVAGERVANVEDRRRLLRGAVGDVADFELGKCVQLGEHALRQEIDGNKAVLVRSQEFDVHGEAGLLSAAWSGFADTQATLPRVVAKLGKAGVRRVVITADHGFVALSRRLGDAYKIHSPKGGAGELHRRAWIGRGGVDHPSVLRMALSGTGVSTDLDLLVPKGLALFKAGGSKQFFHGGLSPQELVIPVVLAVLSHEDGAGDAHVDVGVVGDTISTAMFAATVSFSGNLFASSVKVRAVARRGKDVVVAHVVKGDGFDPASGTIEVPASNDVRLMFQVTKRLDPKDKVEVQVLDVRTDATLGKATVTVSAPVSTFDDDLE